MRTPPDDGGRWTSRKVARWVGGTASDAKLAGRTGLQHVHVPRGWEALKRLDWSVQSPRPKTPKAAGPPEAGAFRGVRKNVADTVAEETRKHPDKPVEDWTTGSGRRTSTGLV